MRPGVVEVIDLAVLRRQPAEVDGAAVDARGRAGLEPGHLEPGLVQLLRQVGHGGLPRPATGEAGLRADVDAAAEEGPGGDDHGLGGEAPALDRLDTGDPATPVEQEARYRPLDHEEGAVGLQL